MAEEYKRLKRELVKKGEIIDYYQDTIETANGNVVKWDFINHHGAAAIVPVTSDGRILMVRQYRNALDRYTLEIPAGGLNENEPTKQAAIRELEEETGYCTKDAEFLISVRTTVAFCNEKIDVYVAAQLTKGRQHLDEDEFLSVKAYSLEELETLIYKGEIQDGKTIAALLAYKNKYC